MKTYSGKPLRRMAHGEVENPYGFEVSVEEADGTRHALKHYVRHSPDGFAWGYGGSGPSDLARCLLLDVFGKDHPATARYQVFKFAHVANWPMNDPWSITEDEIRAWAESEFQEA